MISPLWVFVKKNSGKMTIFGAFPRKVPNIFLFMEKTTKNGNGVRHLPDPEWVCK
jgi:hypothetical protein